MGTSGWVRVRPTKAGSELRETARDISGCTLEVSGLSVDGLRCGILRLRKNLLKAAG
jgi:hypothetical protein